MTAQRLAAREKRPAHTLQVSVTLALMSLFEDAGVIVWLTAKIRNSCRSQAEAHGA